ncbi:hypothetical protein JTE90_027488, partial [Oedothorax gibbosus]
PSGVLLISLPWTRLIQLLTSLDTSKTGECWHEGVDHEQFFFLIVPKPHTQQRPYSRDPRPFFSTTMRGSVEKSRVRYA